MRCSGATHERPRLTRLLLDFFAARKPAAAADFRCTTIQINFNYEAAIHVDKFNLGPSYIVGLGDYGAPNNEEAGALSDLAGHLWVQGDGAVDVRRIFVLFDGMLP